MANSPGLVCSLTGLQPLLIQKIRGYYHISVYYLRSYHFGYS